MVHIRNSRRRTFSIALNGWVNMITITNCSAINCGTGFAIGNGVNAKISGCETNHCGVGYSFHKDANIDMSYSKSNHDGVGIDIHNGHNIKLGHNRLVLNSYGYSHDAYDYAIHYALSYLINVVGYNPYK